MRRFLTTKRLSLLFVALFGVSLAGVFTFQHFWVDPEKKCVADGRWWYEEGGECVTPLYLPELTGRPEGVSRAEWSRRQSRELVDIEHGLAAEKAALAAQTQRDRAALLSKEPN